MALPPVPENLENIVVVRDYLNKLRLAIEEGGTEIDPIFLSQKGQPNGVPVLDSTGLVPTSELGTGVADGTKVLLGDRTWGTAGGGGGGAKAATVVVDPGGNGDVLTLAAGIAALPAAGGYIYMRESTYTISSTQVLPNKDILFIGSGIGSTVINFTGTGTFFSSAFGRHYTFRSLSFNGGSINTAQKLFVSTATDQDVYFQDIEVDGFNHIIDDTGGTTNTFTFTDVEMNLPTFDLTSSFYKGVSTGTVIWNYCSVTLAEASRLSAGGGAFLGSPKWVADHSYIGGPPPSAISDFVIGQAIFDGLRADKIKFIISGDKSQIYGLEGSDVVVTFSGQDLFIDHSWFKRVVGIGFENQLLDITGDEIHIADSTFDGTGNVLDGIILDGPTHIQVIGCRIKNFSTHGIFLNADAVGSIVGNTFTNTGANSVLSTNASSAMVYTGNSGLLPTFSTASASDKQDPANNT